MTNTDQTISQPLLIAVSRLAKSPLNARRTVTKSGIEELKASILAHGLMQNLVVTDAGDGSFRVIAGGRRLEAIHSLQAEAKLTPDFAVPCQVVTEAQALEMSLAENTVRQAMHPADQFDAFAALIEQGESAADVAGRFGVEESLVLKRMKLARVAPELLSEYRGEGMTLECLMAYTITDDHRRQLKVFKSLPQWGKSDPDAIKAALTEKMVESGDKLARFVGQDAYVAAGGSTRTDLFGDAVYFENPSLLQKLAQGKLDAVRKELEAEGWGWVEVHPERDHDAIYRCGRLKPQMIGVPDESIELKSQLDSKLEDIEDSLDDESDTFQEQHEAVQARMDEVERQLAGYVGFDATQKQLAGCFVSVGHDGSLCLDQGLVKPEHRKLLARLLGSDDDKPVRVKPKDGLPEALRRDLAADRLEVAQVAFASNPQIALDLLTFQAASGLFAEQTPSDGPNVEFHRQKHGDEPEATAAHSKLDELYKALPDGWLKAKSEAEKFEAFRSLPEQDRLRLLAYCIAVTLKPKLGTAAGEDATAYDVALSMTGTNVADYWRPTKENFFDRCKRDQLLAIGREVLSELWAQSNRIEKKSLVALHLGRAFSAPEGHTPEQIDKLKHWLPAGMTFDLATAPKPVKGKKARKAA